MWSSVGRIERTTPTASAGRGVEIADHQHHVVHAESGRTIHAGAALTDVMHAIVNMTIRIAMNSHREAAGPANLETRIPPELSFCS